MKKPESRLQASIKEALEREFGGFWWKAHGGPFQRAGIGDLIGCCFGFYFNVEVKTPDDRRGKQALQVDVIERVKSEGGCAFITASVKACLRKVRKYLYSKGITPEMIHEAYENRTNGSSTQGFKARPGKRVIRPVDGTRHGKDLDRPEGHSRKMATALRSAGAGRRS